MLHFSACRVKDDPAPAQAANTGDLTMEFTNMANGRAMRLGADWYWNAAGDTFQITTYKYYISNITVMAANGAVYTEPASYHLIDQSKPDSWKFTLKGLPAADYSSVKFLIGVDSAHNTNGVDTGALDPANGMIWDWSTGYIMAKMEGNTNEYLGPNAGSKFFYHIAGYSGRNCVLQWVSLPFPATATVSPNASHVPGIHLTSEASKWFASGMTFSLFQ